MGSLVMIAEGGQWRACEGWSGGRGGRGCRRIGSSHSLNASWSSEWRGDIDGILVKWNVQVLGSTHGDDGGDGEEVARRELKETLHQKP